MDKICIKNLEVFSNHGVYPEERALGQKFVVSAELFLDLRSAGKSDELDDSFDYGKACYIIKNYIEKKSFRLIEAVAEGLAEKLLIEHTALQSVMLEIKKPWAPVATHLETVSVVIERRRHMAYIALGSNMGDRDGYLQFAVGELKNAHGCRVVSVSGFINTAPYGNAEQDDFLNGCLALDTLLEPLELLELLHDIENRAGRVRGERWGPRTLDLDIIFFDDIIMSVEALRIPHPEAHKREFVMAPLNEIAPYLIHPAMGKTVAEILAELETKN